MVETLDSLLVRQLPEIMQRERNNSDALHLYCVGNYWVAFETSAYQLSLLCRGSQTSALQLRAYPFPVVMTSISNEQRLRLRRGRTLRRTTDNYQVLTVPAASDDSYRQWHREWTDDLLE
ncbi:MAG: hypothetical protein E7099_05545 [Mediterranea massiliensis]|nr:hypothetical protein [Mediterranea massiliensis]